MRVSLAKSDGSFSALPQESLLDAALAARLNLPHSCKGGNCGSCRARLLRGEVHYPHGRPLGLSDAEIADGFVLLCQARARSDLLIETFEMRSTEEILSKRLPARIERAVLLSHDVMGLYLRLPAAEAFAFTAGQYIDIMLPGGRRRSFSIASPPHDSPLLELHVRRVAGGEFTDALFAGTLNNTLLTIEGPLGQFAYRPQTAGRAAAQSGAAAPLLLVGGGTGIAPLLGILRHVIEYRVERGIALSWGVRSERDLYAQATLETLVQSAPAGRLRYTPVLSEPSAGWRGERGLVHEAVLRGVADLDRYDVYAAGPPAMIEAVRREFAARGVPAERLFFDSFDYAPDALERQRMSASMKS